MTFGAFSGERRRGAAIMAAAALGLSLSSCVAGRASLIKAPPPLPPNTSTTAAPDLSGVSLAGAPGRTTTTLAVGPGAASLSGTVSGPNGPIPAPAVIVHVERLVGNAEATQDVATQPDGTWSLPGILGGRYRVRAYRPPDFAELDAQVFWLGGAEARQLALKVDQFSGVNVAAALAPSPAVVGEPAQLVVQVTTRSVDPQGIVRAVPVVGTSVALTGPGSWTIAANPATTTGNGRVAYAVVCQQLGDQPLSAVVGTSDTFPLNLPPCVPEPPATTEPPTTAVSSSTTTPVIGPPGSTSTTPARSTTTTAG
ncbi:MAG TPA: hypothetical protein VF954_05945, partial [Acidimicrobiales bacterium]